MTGTRAATLDPSLAPSVEYGDRVPIYAVAPRGARPEQGTAPLTFSQAADQYLLEWALPNFKSKDWHTKATTMLARFRRIWGSSFLSEISPMQIEQYKAARIQESIRGRARLVSKSCVNRELAVLRGMYNWAHRMRLTDAMPMAGVKMYRVNNRRLVTLNESQIQAALGRCGPRRARLRAFVELAVNTGARKGELLALRWRDIDFERRMMVIETSKNGDSRDIPLNQSALDALRSLRRRRRKDGPYSFLFARDSGFPLQDLRGSWLAVMSELGLSGVRIHDLRHTFASRFLAAGGDVAALQEILGHRTPAMTLRYAHAFGSQKRRAIEMLDRLTIPGQQLGLDTKQEGC